MRHRSGLAGRAAPQAPWRWCWLVLLTLSAGTAAQPSRDGAARRPVRSDTQWLQAIQAAAQRVNFTGTVVYQQGGSMRSSRIVHLWDGRSSHERLQMLDGKAREFIRKDVEVQCLFPEARRVLVERGLPGESFPSIGGGAPREILENYSLKLGNIERVAGVDCQVLLLEPRDALRYGHRLCVEPASSLLLRAETLDLRQEPIDQMAFTDVRINDRIDRALLRPSWSTEGWRVERSDHRPADLARLGWSISPPAGFRVLRQVERR
ncbi:MAG: sigma-E factor regulatory protein RseB domain-containing protein, partial [Betaproteobacteria bacterium]